MEHKEIFINKRSEDFDLAKVFGVLFSNMKQGEREKAISDLASNLSRDEKELLMNILSIMSGIMPELIPFMERMRNEYRRGIPRLLLSKDGDLNREVRSTELAMEDLNKVVSVMNGFINQTFSQVLEARSKFTASIPNISRMITEGSSQNPMSLLNADGNLELKMRNLEEKVSALLEKKEEKR